MIPVGMVVGEWERSLRMAITHREFLRLWERLTGEVVVGGTVGEGLDWVHPLGKGRLQVVLASEEVSSLGRLRLSLTRVTLRFVGVESGLAAEFLARFERFFHRGGG